TAVASMYFPPVRVVEKNCPPDTSDGMVLDSTSGSTCREPKPCAGFGDKCPDFRFVLAPRCVLQTRVGIDSGWTDLEDRRADVSRMKPAGENDRAGRLPDQLRAQAPIVLLARGAGRAGARVVRVRDVRIHERCSALHHAEQFLERMQSEYEALDDLQVRLALLDFTQPRRF